MPRCRFLTHPTAPLVSLVLLPVLAATIACGAAAAPRTAGEARKAATAPPASADESLVKGPVETDAEVARVIREYYTKYEYRIPMRDGARLFTVVYVPKDTQHSYPMLLTRTPYSVAPYGADVYPNEKGARNLRRFAPSAQIVKEGYIIVHQDVRGRMMSEGTFVDIRPLTKKPATPSDTHTIDESTDTFDTIDWLVKNVPNNTGKVGVWGISYPGFYAAQAAVDAHPALKAVSPQAPVTEWFLGDDFHHNGAFFLADAFAFYGNFGKARPEPTKKSPPWVSEHESEDVYDFFLQLGPLSNANAKYFKDAIPFWNELLAHPSRDEWWKARDPRPFYRDAKPAIMTVGGWYDAEDLFGALQTYRSFERQSPKNENVLVMGPWRHGGWSRNDGDRLGDISFGQKTSAFYREHIELPFFQRHLKGKKGPLAPEAWVYETGTNEWRTYPAWPPPEAKPATLYFAENGRLSSAGPTGEGGDDAYTSDPRKPVPYRARPADGIDAEYMTEDQRFAGRRPDVLVYSTGDLDSDVTLSGPLEASLWVSTTGTDADFVVKLIDVWPQDAPDPEPNPTNVHLGGYEQLVRGEIMRGRFRSSFDRPEPFKPNEPALVRYTLPDLSHTFRTGHRIMVQVQSSWFPLADRNPQTFVDISRATEADFRSATHRVYRTKDRPSGLKVMLQRGALPAATR
jgi:putative CocE/NonD family hydrolase